MDYVGNANAGWPASHQSTVHSSALMYDIDKDGIREVALATFNGEVLFFRYIQLLHSVLDYGTLDTSFIQH